MHAREECYAHGRVYPFCARPSIDALPPCDFIRSVSVRAHAWVWVRAWVLLRVCARGGTRVGDGMRVDVFTRSVPDQYRVFDYIHAHVVFKV